MAVQSSTSAMSEAAAGLLAAHDGPRLHADGAHACGSHQLVRRNKVAGRCASAGVDEIQYHGSLNAYDWHTVLIDRLPQDALLREPTAVVITGFLTPYLTNRLREPERLAFIRHSVAAANALAKRCPVYCIEDFARAQDRMAAATALAGLGPLHEAVVSREEFRLAAPQPGPLAPRPLAPGSPRRP